MTSGVRRLSHEQAEMLISDRMDSQLDRADSRALLVHLQTCEACRAFAVQTEILGRELEALPILPASTLVDRRIREAIVAKSKRWSLTGFFPTGGGSGGLRAAAGALAVLALVSVYLLIRMAGSNPGGGTSIEAPNGAVAQQLERTATSSGVSGEIVSSGPTETPRVVSPPTQPGGNGHTVEPAQAGAAATEPTTQNPTRPTATLDSTFVYAIDSTRTPAATSSAATSTSESNSQPATEESDAVVAAAVADLGTPEPAGVASASTAPSATPELSTTPPEQNPVQELPATPDQVADASSTISAPETIAEPTMTPTPVEISVAAAEATQDSAQSPIPPPASESAPDRSSSPSQPATASAGEQTATPTAHSANESAPVTTPQTAPAETPFAQPTIAPLSGRQPSAPGHDNSTQGAHEGQDNGTGDSSSGDHSPRIEPNNDADVQAASAGDGSGGSPQIISTDGATIPDGSGSVGDSQPLGDESGVGGETPNASPAPVITSEPTGLDLSSTDTTLPAGTSSPPGRLAFSPTLDLFAVIAPDGQLAVANRGGELVVMLGTGELPVWSGSAMMFSVPGDNGAVVGIWNSDSGDLGYIPASEDEASSDLPIGGGGQSFYFLRTFPDRPGAMEIHRATIDGSDDGVVWSADSITLGGVQPVWSSNGILLPTDSVWLLIDSDGHETELGQNPYGFVGTPILSPGEGLIAYSAGDRVIVAWTEDPGTAVATAPYGGATGGYAFSTSGEEIVVSDGMALHVVSYEGDDLGTLSGTRPIGAVAWPSDTIYYLQIGDDAALQSTTLQAIQSS